MKPQKRRRYNSQALKPVVYVGPTMSRAEAQQTVDAEFRPPVRRGDLTYVEPHRIIVIIDGEFGQTLSVSPKEILKSIDAGAFVIGASSMGALRAAELYPFGMRGVGWVYKNYRSGRITGDDEVALNFSPIDGRALTVPLVNVRFWVDELAGQGLLSKHESREVIGRARGIFFADRTPGLLHAELENVLGADRCRDLLVASGGEIPDIKYRDCRRTLRLLAKLRMEPHYRRVTT